MSRVISFCSGKGGVGKTTLVSNLGTLWAQSGKRTLLVDGDWALGKLGIALGSSPRWTIDRVLRGEASLEEAVAPIGENLFLLASPSGVLGFEEMTIEQRHQLFYEIDALGEAYDTVLFDHSSGIDWSVLQFAAAAHQHVVVTTPEPTSYADAYAIMKLLSKRFGVREFWLIMTMGDENEMASRMAVFSEFIRDQLNIRVHCLETFGSDSRLSESIRLQRPFVSRFPTAVLTARLRKVCSRLSQAELSRSNGLQFFSTQDAFQSVR